MSLTFPFTVCIVLLHVRQNSEINELKKLVSELSVKISSLEVQSSPALNDHTIGQTELTSASKLTTIINKQPAPKTRQLDDRRYNLVVSVQMGQNVQTELNMILKVRSLFYLNLTMISKQIQSEITLDWANSKRT